MRVSNKKDNSIFYNMKESLKRVLSLLDVPENEYDDLEDVIYSSDKDSTLAETLQQNYKELKKIEHDTFEYKPKRENKTRKSLNKTSINAIQPIDIENVNNKKKSDIKKQIDLEK